MRYAALKNRTARAIAVMEPFISLGLKEGAHIIAASFYRGGEVIAPTLTPEQRKAYYDAENKAVDLINAEVLKIMERADVKEAWAKQGAVPMPMSPSNFDDYLRADIEKWAQVVKVSGAKAE